MNDNYMIDSDIWFINDDDLIRKKLRWQISAWYDHWYMGGEEKKKEHLRIFDDNFDIMRFDGLSKEEIEKEEIKFLHELQNIVDKKEIE